MHQTLPDVITVLFSPSSGGQSICLPFPMPWSERDPQTLASLRRIKEGTGTFIFERNRKEIPEDLALLYRKAGEHARGEHKKKEPNCIGCGTRVMVVRQGILQAAGCMKPPAEPKTRQFEVPAEMM